MERDILFAKIAVKNRACTKEQVQEAYDQIADGGLVAQDLPGALVEMGAVTRDTAGKILAFIATYRATSRSEDSAGPDAGDAPDQPPPMAQEGRPAPAPVDDPDRTPLPALAESCVECSRPISIEDLEKEEAYLLFGEFYCGPCADEILTLLRFHDARYTRSLRKHQLDLRPPSPPSGDEGLADLVSEMETEDVGDIEIAEDIPLPGEAADPEPAAPEPAKKNADASVKKRKASARMPKVAKPPPLPRVTDVDELSEAEIKDLEKLVSKGKEDAAVAKLARAMRCSPEEAKNALDRLIAETQAQSGGGGLFGFAKNLRRSSAFSMAVWRQNWDRVVEQGEDWLAEEPDNLDVLLNVAEAFRNLDKLGKAEKLLRRALEKKPTELAPRARLARVLSLRGKWGEAFDAYSDLLSRDGGKEESRRGLVEAAFHTGNRLAALPEIDVLLEGDPEDALDLLEKKLAILYGDGQFNEAFKLLPSLLRKEKRPYPRGLFWTEKLLAEVPDDIRGLRQVSRIRERRDEFAAAYSACRAALAHDRDDPKTLERFVTVARRIGKLGDVVSGLLRLEGLGKLDLAGQLDLARELARSGRLEDACKRYETWLAQGGTDASGLLEIARLRIRFGRVEEGMAAMKDAADKGLDEAATELEALSRRRLEERIDRLINALSEEGADPSLRTDLVDALAERGLVDAAVEQAMIAADTEGTQETALDHLSAHFSSNPTDRKVAFFLAEHHRKRGKALDAAAVLETYRVKSPDDPEANRSLMEMLLESNEHGKALGLIEDLSRFGDAYADLIGHTLSVLCEKAPDEARVFKLLGRYQALDGKTGDALENLKKAVRLDPSLEIDLAPEIAVFAEKQGDLETMRHAMERMLEPQPDHLVLQLRLAASYFEAGELDNAEKHWKAVLASDPENLTASQRIKDLEAKRQELHLNGLRERWSKNPDDAANGIELGKALLGADQDQEGVKVLNSYRGAPEVGWKALEALYSHYRGQGDFARALAFLKELMPRRRPARNSREWKEITYRMGDLYLSLADPVRAGRAFFDIFKADPKFRDVKQMMELVEVMEELVDPTRTGAPRTWHVAVEASVEGPLDLTTIKEWVDQDRLSPDDLIWQPGFSGWKRAIDADTIGLLFKYRDRL